VRLIGAASIVFVFGLPIAISAFAPETLTVPSPRQVADESHRCGQTSGRSDTFADEQLRADTLRKHEETVAPATAFAAGFEGEEQPASEPKGICFESERSEQWHIAPFR
jgi:hypothetical protein